jgi:ABC-type nitrate/sulfonate/bicarbonate transport system ATPase subunit
VLAQDADIVLMDEPFAALDAMTRDNMHDELERIWTEVGLTVVFVTHNVREAVRLGDRTILMESGPGGSSASTTSTSRAHVTTRIQRSRRCPAG